jgi:hypothetical protein
MTWALAQQGLKTPAKFLLLLLAYRTNPDTETADASIDNLARECGMSRSGVKLAMQKLADGGLVEVVIRPVAGGKNQPNLYRLNLAHRGHDVTPGRGHDVTGDRGHVVTAKAGSNSKTVITGEGLNFDSWPCKPSEPVLIAWLAQRKRKHADNSELAMSRMGKELHRAVAIGWTVDEAIEEQIFRNWTALKAEWLNEKPQPVRAGAEGQPPRGSGNHAGNRNGSQGGRQGTGAIDRVLRNAGARAAAATAGDGAGSDRGGHDFELRGEVD